MCVGLIVLVASAGAWSAANAPRSAGPQISSLPVTYRSTPITPPPPVAPSTTTVPTPSQPLPPAAEAAVSMAQMGQRLSYSATYRLTPVITSNPGEQGVDASTLVVAQVGNPEGGWPTEWSYRLEWPNGSQFEMESQPGGTTYTCALVNPTSRWSRDGPHAVDGGNAGVNMVGFYMPMTVYDDSLEATLVPGGMARTSSAVMAGQSVQCVTDDTTWCWTPLGIFARFPAIEDIDPGGRGFSGQLVSWSGVVSAQTFTLPGPVTSTEGLMPCANGPC